MTIANTLLEFLMNLLRDPDAAEEFRHDPEKALNDAGLGDINAEDVDAIMPVVLDYAPVRIDSSFDRDFSTGGNASWGGSSGPGWGGDRGRDRDDGKDRDDDGKDGGWGDDDHGHAVQQLTHIVNHYSYSTEIDDRDNVVDQSTNQNIWADGDVTQWFDSESVIASGDDSLAAGDDVRIDSSTDESVNVEADDDAEVNIGNTELAIDDSFNEDRSVDIDDSFNDDHSETTEVEDSYNDNSETTTEVDIDDSFNDESVDADVDVKDSFNEDNDGLDVEELEVDTTVDNSSDDDVTGSYNEETTTELDVDTTVTDESINDSFTVDDSFNEETDVKVEDNFSDNSAEIEGV